MQEVDSDDLIRSYRILNCIMNNKIDNIYNSYIWWWISRILCIFTSWNAPSWRFWENYTSRLSIRLTGILYVSVMRAYDCVEIEGSIDQSNLINITESIRTIGALRKIWINICLCMKLSKRAIIRVEIFFEGS